MTFGWVLFSSKISLENTLKKSFWMDTKKDKNHIYKKRFIFKENDSTKKEKSRKF